MAAPTKADIEAAFYEAKKQDRLCPVGKLVAEHEHGSVIASKVSQVETYSASTISRVLKGLEIALSVESIQKHRRGTCKCMG